MPRQGWVSITVSDELYFKLQGLAKKDEISIQKEIENLLQLKSTKENDCKMEA